MQPATRTTHSLAEAICFHYISHSALVMLSRHPWTPRSTTVQCQSVLLKNAKSLPRSSQRRNKKSSKLIEPYAMQQQQHRLPSSKPSSHLASRVSIPRKSSEYSSAAECAIFFGFTCLKAFSLMGSHTLTVVGKPQIGKDLNRRSSWFVFAFGEDIQ